MLLSFVTVASWGFLTKAGPPQIWTSVRKSLLLVVIVLGIVWDRKMEVAVEDLKKKVGQGGI
jgi:hypothetical protein